MNTLRQLGVVMSIVVFMGGAILTGNLLLSGEREIGLVGLVACIAYGRAAINSWRLDTLESK